MKKSVRIGLLIALEFFIVLPITVFGYCGSENTKTISNRNNINVSSVEKLSFTNKPNNEPTIQESNTKYYPIREEKQNNYNRILIPGALDNHLMKDTTGENFYLDHDINGNYDGRGVPYIDFRTDFSGRKTIIYSHSSTTGNGPFQALQNYHYNKGYYDSHRYIKIYYNGNTYTYEIFSVYVSVADNDESEGLEYFYNTDYTDSEWQEALNRYKSHSDYDTGVSVNSSDKILILQTCSMDPNYYEKYYRYNMLVMGKLV